MSVTSLKSEDATQTGVMRTNIIRVEAEEILRLRHQGLRTNRPIDVARFEGDHAKSSWHLAAVPVDENGWKILGSDVIGCASFIAGKLEDHSTWQLQGLVVTTSFRKMGLGRNLLAYAESHIPTDTGIHLFLCDAPLETVRFFEKCGWMVISDQIDVQDFGACRKMVRQL
jgi:GNAT superfamily N-acetyltransferase